MKVTNILLSMLLLLCCTEVAAQINLFGFSNTRKVEGNCKYVTKEIRLSEFNNLSVSGNLSVCFTQHEGKAQVKLYCSENIADLVEIYVENNTLKAKVKKGYNIVDRALEIRVTAPQLNSVSVSGSGDVRFANDVNNKRITLTVSGSGNIEANQLQCEKLYAQISGSGDVTIKQISTQESNFSISGSGDMNALHMTTNNAIFNISGSGEMRVAGSAEKASFNIAGSGEMDAREFVAKRVNCSVSGSGDIRCHATKYLKVSIAGSGNVGYKGSPEELYIPKKNVYKL